MIHHHHLSLFPFLPHPLLLRAQYFYKSEQAKEALFQQLLLTQDEAASEGEVAKEHGYVTRLMKEIQKGSGAKANTKSVEFYPTENPMYVILTSHPVVVHNDRSERAGEC